MSRLFIGSHRWVGFITFSLLLFVLFVSGCTKAAENESPQAVDSAMTPTEGSASKAETPKPTQVAEDSGGDMEGHPDVQNSEKLERRVLVPKVVEGKWKAVKILIRNKMDESKNVIKTVAIGSSFILADSGIRVTVGPFFPNFVMDQGTYTSMNNQVINPAVQLVVEENGKVLYKGWTFAKYPTMYAFEHEVFALELKDHIAMDVS